MGSTRALHCGVFFPKPSEARTEVWVGWSWIEPMGHKLDAPQAKAFTCKWLKYLAAWIRRDPNHSLLVPSPPITCCLGVLPQSPCAL